MARFSRSLFPPLSSRAVSTPVSTGTLTSSSPNAGASFPEPEWSRPLLLGLVTFFALAQLLFEGMRFGLNAPGHPFSLALMDALWQSSRGFLSPSSSAGDAWGALAGLQASPFWWLMARAGDVLGSNYLAFLSVHVLARWWAMLAIFRLAERAFGHALTGILAVALWAGYSDLWPGGAALHHDYLAHPDVALALLLWALVAWSQNRATWGLLCGLAMCIDAPPAVATFALLSIATWWSKPTAPVAAARKGPNSRLRQALDEAARRVNQSWQAAGWFALGALPFWAQLISHRAEFASSGFAASLGWLTRMNAPHAIAADRAGASWRLLVLLGIGGLSWRRASRQSPDVRALGHVNAWLSVVVAAGVSWLWFQGLRAVARPEVARPEVATALGACLPRLAPLAVSLGIVGVAHVLERAMARRGSGGLMAALLLVFGFITVPAPPPLWLLFGLCFMEAAQRSDRAPEPSTNADGPLAASLRLHGLWWTTGALAILALLCAAFPILALKITGASITWATVGWMAASLLAWIATRPPRDPNAGTTLFSSYTPPGALAQNTSAAWNRARQSPRMSRHMSTHLARLASGRFALVVFVLAFGWRARGAAGWRLRQGGGPLSSPQPQAWQAAQLWAKNNSPRDAVFLATRSGWRAFSRRAVFADPADGDLTPLSPAFARQWNWKSKLAAPLWNQDLENQNRTIRTRARFTPRDLRLLRVRGVTHLVLPSDRLWPRRAPWLSLLRPIYKNREWAIYVIEQT